MNKRDWTPEQRRSCAVAGLAMPYGDYPILDREDLQNAVDTFDQARDKDSAKTHITGRAKTLGATDLLAPRVAGQYAGGGQAGQARRRGRALPLRRAPTCCSTD